MLISTSTEPFDKMGDIKSILVGLKEVGFEAYDYSMSYQSCKNTSIIPYEDWKERAIEIRKMADAIGIICNQSHAPAPSYIIGAEEYNKKVFVDIIKAVEVTGILGGKICVIHPCNDWSAEENAQFYNQLLPIAKEANVKIGLENMWNWDGQPTLAACSHHDDFAKHLQLLDKEWFVANVDIGHAEMQTLNTSAVEMLYTLKDRVQALHIHDNDKYHDNHAIPFTMQIDFIEICKALKEIGYSGDITLEVSSFPNIPKTSLRGLMLLMVNSAKHIREQV